MGISPKRHNVRAEERRKDEESLLYQDESTEVFRDEEEEPLTLPPPRSSKSLPDEGIQSMKKPRKKTDISKKGFKKGSAATTSASTASTTTKPQQKNMLFQDVDNTGEWGSISRTEKIIVGVVLALIVIAVLMWILLSSTSDADSNSQNDLSPMLRTSTPTTAPSHAPPVDPISQLETLLPLLQNNSFANRTTFPSNVDDYLLYQNSEPATAPLRALAWILFDDPLDPPPDSPWLLQRYALAILYFDLAGPSWNNHTGWLTARDTCSWHGVYCNRFKTKIIEIDLNHNNLQGQLPAEINLLSSLVGLVLSNNKLSGEFPQLAVGSLPSLTRLFIDSNQFTGSISTDLRANGVLSTLMAQHNEFQGRWPRTFCTRSGQPEQFSQFAIDCEKNSCQCCTQYNCF